jgi:frataxin-like iron-binding protein CyaY
MKNVSLGLALLTLFSCGSVTQKNKGKKFFADLLKDVDKVQLKFFNHGDTLSEAINDQSEINIYKELINGKRDPKLKIKCDSTGQILFLSKNDVVLSAWFSSRASGSKYDKGCVTYSVDPEHFGSALTVRSGQDIDDYYYKLRSTAIRMAQQ